MVMLKPHGGRLVQRVMGEKKRRLTRRRWEEGDWPTAAVDDRQAVEVENLATGVYSPLTGFMNRQQVEHVLTQGRLLDDLPWTIPIVLTLTGAQIERLRGAWKGEDKRVVLVHEGSPLALLTCEEVFRLDKRAFAESVYGTDDPHHPGVQDLKNRGDFCLAGEVDLLAGNETSFARFKLRPMETRVLFGEKGWRTIVGFQTRNAPHLGHEYVQKTALTFVDGIFINPVLGRKKKGDFKDEVILKAYRALLNNYYLKDYTVLAVLEYAMRYAGPKEAIHHAIMRKNFGCTHFVVGRDHAGVGDYYGKYEAQEIFDRYPDLGITPLPFKSFFYCRRCGSVANTKICPHGEANHLLFSGSKIRRLFQSGRFEALEDLMRREVIAVITEFERPFIG